MPPEAHLTPRTLVGRRFPPDVFDGIRVAIVGYCPPPSVLDRYAPEKVTDQHFIHVSPDSVRIVRHAGARFLSIAHVYGGPVSSALMEELAYYGIEVVLAYGLAGGLGTRGLAMGDFYLVEDAHVADGTTPHYTSESVVPASPTLAAEVTKLWSGWSEHPLHPVRAATGDAIYRETDAVLGAFREAGADIVNCDSSHLYAVARANAEGRSMQVVQCGVVSDVIAADGSDAESTLAVMLADGGGSLNPLELTGTIVSFYLEVVAGSAAAASP